MNATIFFFYEPRQSISSKTDRIWQLVRSSHESNYYGLYKRYWNLPSKLNYFQLNTKLLWLYAQKYFLTALSILMILFVQGLLLLQSVLFFRLEAKNIWLLDGLKQCNRIHISMTSAAICVGSDNVVGSVTERANKPPLVKATCRWIICTGPCLNTSHFVTIEQVVASCTYVNTECLNGISKHFTPANRSFRFSGGWSWPSRHRTISFQ